MSIALLLDNDLFFSVKVTDTLRYIGIQTRTVRRLEDFLQQLANDLPDVALVNTAARGIDWRVGIVAAHRAKVPCVAFGSHVDTETQAAARQAGATRVISNARLASDLPGVIERVLRRESKKSESAAEAATSSAAAKADSALPSSNEPQ